jgi:hypothetical protein
MGELHDDVEVFDDPDALVITPPGGLDSAFELPRFEVCGELAPLRELAHALAGLIPAGQVDHLRLHTEPRPDPADGGLRHLLEINVTGLIQREPVWEQLYDRHVRVCRWLVPHWRWDPWRYGVIVGPAPVEQVEAALNVLWEAAAGRIVYVEPPGAPRDDAVRELLRSKAEVLCLGARPDDPDRPAERLETAVTTIRCAAPLPSAAAARALHNKQQQRLLIAPHRELACATLEETWPLKAQELRLGSDERYFLGVGSLTASGLVLLACPQEGRARWLRAE